MNTVAVCVALLMAWGLLLIWVDVRQQQNSWQAAT